MRLPSARSLAEFTLAAIFLLLGTTVPVLAQSDPNGAPVGTEPVIGSLFTSAIGSALTTLVVGGLLVALAPERTRELTDTAIDRPGAAFGYGFLTLIVFIGAVIMLAITVIGILVVIPLALVFAIVALVGGELGYLAVGRLASERWSVVIAVAVVVSGVTGFVPVLGTIVAFVISSIGIGTIAMAVIDDGSTQRGGRRSRRKRRGRDGATYGTDDDYDEYNDYDNYDDTTRY
ncbi:hypothetical protein [Natrialba asiatica]|uniref:DUF8173 domain-containing protein n=1 Tax=Natrialba asiatica (strain ATCC 700177 / DSM 12278 / JCM 9576 / FERM P-10747 / NBRC 102637 / 172P1) TaxID=29540 RepID=M0B2B4_NATA1|nr:hypothetical protein [Natrialba asiatica]ELZ04692.1 hypothetical protein C481_04081 [Natrialba asiatica DSM 12278]